MSNETNTALNTADIRAQWQKPDNQHELFVFQEEDVPALWVSQQVNAGRLRNADAAAVTRALTDGRYPASEFEAARIKDKIEQLLGYVATAKDSAVAAGLMKDFRGLGKYRITTYHGRRYIVFEGSPRMRNIVTGSRYRLDNPKIVGLGIGKAGLKNAAIAGARLTIVLFAAYRVGEFLLEDEATLSYFVGHFATDIVKAVAGVTASYGAGVMVAGFVGGGVLGPLIVAIAIGGLATYTLDRIDERYGITEALVAELNNIQRSVEKETTDFFSDLDSAIYNFFLGRINPGGSGFLPSYR